MKGRRDDDIIKDKSGRRKVVVCLNESQHPTYKLHKILPFWELG